MTATSQFYTGLVARLYEPLAGQQAEPAIYQRFVEKHGEPALELACGGGHPMLSLMQSGLDVHGLDASADLLDSLKRKATQLGLTPTLYHQTMQTLSVEGQYACCYLAGASFCLIDDLADAQEALCRVYAALIPGGHFLLSVFEPPAAKLPSAVRSTTLADGSVATVQSISEQRDTDQQQVSMLLRYTCTLDGKTENVERPWRLRWYRANQLTDMLQAVGFNIIKIASEKAASVDPRATNFYVVAQK
jgi:SAM-dependent methyltransferase